MQTKHDELQAALDDLHEQIEVLNEAELIDEDLIADLQEACTELTEEMMSLPPQNVPDLPKLPADLEFREAPK